MLFSEAFRSLPCLPFESTFPQENPLSQIVYDYPLYIRLDPDPFPLDQCFIKIFQSFLALHSH